MRYPGPVPDAPWSDPVADISSQLTAAYDAGQVPQSPVAVSPRMYELIKAHRPAMLDHVVPVRPHG
ncbi:hypothetical protein SEA_MARIOKART_68 [Gordonia phage Mariokart]|nr:hypothetical protein SEA_MARIOKART_68 [Gordonia phage Mariokart]